MIHTEMISVYSYQPCKNPFLQKLLQQSGFDIFSEKNIWRIAAKNAT